MEKLSKLEQVEYLGELCWKNRVNNTEEAIEYGKLAIELATEINALNYLAQVRNYLGVCYINYKFDTNNAVPQFRDALEIALQIKDSVQIAYAYNNLGDVYIFSRNYPLALKYSLNATHYFEMLKNWRGVSYSYINIGQIYRAQKKYEMSLNYLFQSLRIRTNLQNKWNVAGVNFDIGETYYASENYIKAREYIENAIPFYDKDVDKVGIANCYNSLGKISYRQGDYTNSVKYFEKSKVMNKSLKNDNGIIGNNIGLALVYSKLERRNIGEKLLSEALSLAKSFPFYSRARDVNEAYSEFYLNLKDYRAASERYNSFISFHDSLMAAEKVELINELQSNYEMNKRLSNTEYRLERSNTEGMYLYIVVFLLLLSFIFFMWRYRTNKVLNERLKESNLSKDRLFKVISHDLKGPFNSLMGFSSMLLNDYENISSKEHISGLNEINNSVNKIYKLLENMLDWSRIESGKIKAHIENVDITKLIATNCDLYSRSAQNKKIMIQNFLGEEQVFVIADDYMLNSVIRNILSNAIKYSYPGGGIEITKFKEGKNVIINIKDEGVGLSPDQVESLFIEDNILSRKGTDQEYGTGLGLFLSKEFIDHMGGSIWASSNGEKGATFSISLPSATI